VAPLFGFYLLGDMVALAALSVLTVLIFWRHRANIKRLLSGEEGRLAKRK